MLCQNAVIRAVDHWHRHIPTGHVTVAFLSSGLSSIALIASAVSFPTTFSTKLRISSCDMVG